MNEQEKKRLEFLEKENTNLKKKLEEKEKKIKRLEKDLDDLKKNIMELYSNHYLQNKKEKKNEEISINDSILAKCLQEELDNENKINQEAQLPKLKVNVKKEMTQSEINRLGSEKFSLRNHYSNNDCTFCLEKFKNGDDLRRLSCLHVFHKNCIDPWLRKNGMCPIDKVSVEID